MALLCFISNSFRGNIRRVLRTFAPVYCAEYQPGLPKRRVSAYKTVLARCQTGHSTGVQGPRGH